jgi:molybdopterin converting factor small subunit
VTRLLIHFQGVFEDRVQRKDEVLEISSPSLTKVTATLGRIYGRLFLQAIWVDSGKMRSGVSVLVNGRPRGWEAPLDDGDEILFMTPLGGFHG